MRRFHHSWLLRVSLAASALLGACGDSGGDAGDCAVGGEGCACTDGGGCDPGLECLSNVCVDPDSSTAGDGDGDSSGEGDVSGDGDGDGDPGGSKGDGDGDVSGDGDGGTGGSPGDGDGDPGGSAGDGDGDTGGTSSGGNGSGGAMSTGGIGCVDGNLAVPVTYRDFNADHSDFEPGCGSRVEGMVAPMLNEAGKPEYAGTGLACSTELGFSQWFQDSEESASIVSNLVLFPDGQGGHVNRHGPSGQQWETAVGGTIGWCGYTSTVASCEEAAELGDCSIAFDPMIHECWEMGSSYSVAVDGTQLPSACCTDCFCAGTRETALIDGAPLFFPLDGHSEALDDTRYPARLSPQYYGAAGWPWEPPGDPNDPSQPLHNFDFTAELRIPFEYQTGMEAELTMVKDDDAFVFINGHLLIDLGGLHVPYGGTISFESDGTIWSRVWQPEETPVIPADSVSEESTTTAALGLEPGETYEIQVFLAERKQEGSVLLLSVSGFPTNAYCRP